MQIVRKLCKPWLIVLIGVAMTIASALISHSQIMKNNSAIRKLEKETQQADQAIASRWQDMARFERDGNVALLMTAMMGQPAVMTPTTDIINNLKLYVRHFIQKSDAKIERLHVETALQDISPLQNQNTLFQALTALVVAERALVVQTVDQLYIEKVAKEEKIRALEAANTSHTSTALLLQILGLIFVLSKDLARREWPK